MTAPNRNVRIGGEWDEAKASAARQGIKLAEWISEAITAKLAREQAELIAKLTGDSVVDINRNGV